MGRDASRKNCSRAETHKVHLAGDERHSHEEPSVTDFNLRGGVLPRGVQWRRVESTGAESQIGNIPKKPFRFGLAKARGSAVLPYWLRARIPGALGSSKAAWKPYFFGWRAASCAFL